MIQKINAFLSSLPMTLAAGLFLLLDLIPHLTGEDWQLFSLPFDAAWVAIIVCGLPLLYLALWRVVYNPGISKISSALLICMAMFAALAVGDLFAAGEVAFIMALGALLEDATVNRAKKGLTTLMQLAPEMGRRLKDGTETMIPACEISKGDVLRVLPGEKIPADGQVISGESAVDQSIVTGEALPVDVGPGDAVFCGTLNGFGAVDIRAAAVGEDSTLKRLIAMMQEAEKNQAPMQRIADKCASWLVPTALLIALLAWLGTGDMVRGVTVLVVFCPCALVLATPTAVMAAIGQAAKRGVIIKSGEALEQMGKAEVVAFDKTGTLTVGSLTVSDILPWDGAMDDTALLRLLASAEAKSEHPLGRAIVACARDRGLTLTETAGFRMTAGRGLEAQVEGRALICGSEAFLMEKGVELSPKMQSELLALRNQGKATVLVAEKNRCLGAAALTDTLRPEARAVIASLSAMGVKTALLTGDNGRAAAYFAERLGISEVQAELLPGEKVDCVRAFQRANQVVCMVGDGVNDAPALKTADVSVAMGKMGSAITVEAAEVALMQDDIARLPYLKRLSDATVKTIKGSIALSMTINAVAIVLSVLGFELSSQVQHFRIIDLIRSLEF